MMTDTPSRQAGAAQGMTLVASAWVAVFTSAALLGPVLPRMTEAFARVPHVELLIALVATLPSLFVALLAVPFGVLADRLGHRRILFWACLVYGIVGIAPYWIDSLPWIVFARGLVGINEAAIMTCGAALIGEYYSGKQRDRWYAIQSGSGPLAGIVAILIGGLLGSSTWHAPFLVYGFGFVLFALVAGLLWEPARAHSTASQAPVAGEVNGLRLGLISATTLFAMSAFFVFVIQTGFLLTERGVTSPASIGLWQGLASVGNVLGAGAFLAMSTRAISKTALSFLLMAAGFATVGLTQTWPWAVGGALLANIGCGIILPTLLTWAMEGLPQGTRGRGAGLWMCANFLGQFFSPLAMLALKGATGDLSGAMLVYGAGCAVAFVIAGVVGMRMKAEPLPQRN